MAPQLIAALKLLKARDIDFLNSSVIAVGGLIFAELLHIKNVPGSFYPAALFAQGILRRTASRQHKQQKE
jgi:hypothetical protein